MYDDTTEPFWFPAVGRKKVTAAFDGGRLTSDGGVMLLAAAERRIGIAQRLAGLITDPRNPLLVRHAVVDILRARMLAIACSYEDADDLDHLRSDPGFKLACGRLPDTADDLCSQDPYLAGPEISLADLFLAPIFTYLAMTPDATERLKDCSGLRNW
jgi:Transposase DDE domain group 1